MKYIYLLSFLIISVHGVQAQQELTLRNMNGVVQSAHTNPSSVPMHKMILTLGSSYHVNVKNTGFTYNQFLAQVETTETGQRVLDIGRLANDLKLNGKDYVHSSASADIFGLNFKAGKNRFSLNITEHVQARLGYSSSLLDLAVEGNTPGSTTSLDGYKLNGMHYREIGLGFNRKILAEDKLVVGGRIKTLFGMSNVRTVRSNVNLHTAGEEDLYAITADADILVRTAGVDMLEEVDIDYLTNMANLGLGLDLGASYQYSSALSFSASIINLGYIKWKEGVTNYKSQGVYTFTGINNNELFSGSFEFDETEVIDSIASVFEFDETNEAYSTSLPTQIYLSGSYQLASKTMASATLYSDFMGGFRKGMSLGVTQTLGRWFQASASYTMHARSYNNLGLGIAMGTGLQFHAVTDNLLALMQPGNAKLANMRAGFNFLF
ncbi:hypothetical protein OKW21_004322 [Catalinimonas alkaloidigena]|uniref:DUF5723 family protein n=1 Tax=Catalinimonas alkaloidigena TaxID=1075417 RepID=UPI002405ED61|nr:DUF5723 family protein [Catalinimonas alkaloidigena]MDF9799059.1 hypothetical protein [Catalinimonas alkaloidigena]